MEVDAAPTRASASGSPVEEPPAGLPPGGGALEGEHEEQCRGGDGVSDWTVEVRVDLPAVPGRVAQQVDPSRCQQDATRGGMAPGTAPWARPSFALSWAGAPRFAHEEWDGDGEGWDAGLGMPGPNAWLRGAIRGWSAAS